MFKVTLEKAKKPKTFWVIENAKEFQKEVNMFFTDYQNASDCVNPDSSLPPEGSRKNIVMLLVLQWRLCLTSASQVIIAFDKIFIQFDLPDSK